MPLAFRTNSTDCDIIYADYQNLNSYEAQREAEAAVLQVTTVECVGGFLVVIFTRLVYIM